MHREFELLGKCIGLSEDNRMAIRSDFRAGCAAYATELSTKLNLWSSSNPYVLFGLGSHNGVAATVCASMLVRLWMESVKQELEHPRATWFFGNVILHAQLIDYHLSEKRLSAHPEVDAEAVK